MSVEFKQEFQVDNVSHPQQQDAFHETDVRQFQQEPEHEEELSLQEHQEPEEEAQDGIDEQSEEDNQEIEAHKRRKQRDPAKARINQIQRERYAALEANNRLRDENERLKRLATMTTESASKQFEDNVLQRFERAKQLKMQAYENGDIQAQTNADVELADAMADYKSHNNWKAQEALKAQEAAYQPQVNPTGPIVNEREARGWVERNPWVNPNTPDYDPELFQLADNAASQLDLYCYKNGQGHLIQSPQYFQELDNYINQARQALESQQRPQSQGRSQIPMRQSNRNSVMPVRGSTNAQSTSRQKAPLSAEQKAMASSLGISEDLYRQEMLRDMKEKPDRYTYRGGR